MKYRKPPVVEVWISVDFDPNGQKLDWDLRLADQFIHLYKDEFPQREVERELPIEIEADSSTIIPRVVSKEVRVRAVRLWNVGRSRMLQIREDHLSVHDLKTIDHTPGYHAVRDAAAPKIRDYINTFRPTQIRNATLHYLDVIEIPRPADGKLDLTDYIVPVVDVPEDPFGPISGLTQQFRFDCPIDAGPLFLQFQALPSPEESRVVRIQMDWHKQSSDVNTLDLEQVWARMDVAHHYMRQCFQTAFKASAHQLFEPISEHE